MVFLDSSFIVDYLRGNKDALKVYDKFEEANQELFISTVSIMEVVSGAYRSQKTNDEIEKIKKLLSNIGLYDFTEECAFEAGKVEAELAKKGNIIDTEDIMIASTALISGPNF